MDAGLEQWTDFNVAMLGATAALAGLVIVAASVNIREIITSGTLTPRLAAGISALVLALIVSGMALVPEIDPVWFGGLIIFATAVAGAFQLNATRVIARDPATEDRARVAKSVAGFLPIAAYLAAGVLLVVGQPGGLIMAAAGALLAIVSAILISWIVLVEVLR
ncbi:hypothetical protein ACLQ2Q_12545 [Microbacterium sp. DT81.1]|uniref:hypothetical protein n=1 Tax=Microbacterium sp. DT81.1 TaxID=3393413 RepID=UPI003CF616DC